MKKYILLSIIPIIFSFSSLYLRSIQGPYYFSMRYDPSYVYLISSLNVSQGFGVGHMDHPGVPLQILGAIVIKTLFAISGQSPNIAESVFSKPEEYLNAVDMTLIFINTIGIFLMGLIIYSSVRNILVCLLLQLTPLFCYTSFDKADPGLLNRFSQISPENFLIFVILIFIALLIKYTYEKNPSSKKLLFYTIAFALLCGIGTATKIVFVPLILIPFIMIQRMYRKIIFLVLSIVFFIIIVFPTIAYPNLFTEYLINTIIRSGRYGVGDSTVVDTSMYLVNLEKISNSQLFFFSVIGLVCIFYIFSLIRRKKFSKDVDKNKLKLLAAILLSIVLNIILISKNYYQHYIMTSIMFSVVSLYLVISVFKDKFPKKFTFNHALIILISILTIFITYNYLKYYCYASRQNDEGKKIMNFVNSINSKDQVILSFGVTHPEFALAYSTVYGARQINYYKSLLAKKSSGALFYEIYGGSIRYLGDDVNAENSNIIKQKLTSARKIIFMSKGYVTGFDQNEALLKILRDNFQFKNCKLTKLFSNNNYESVYELSLNNN